MDFSKQSLFRETKLGHSFQGNNLFKTIFVHAGLSVRSKISLFRTCDVIEVKSLNRTHMSVHEESKNTTST